MSGVRPKSELAFTSAPASTSSLTFSTSSTAHVSAVAPALLRTFGSAPASSSCFTSAGLP